MLSNKSTLTTTKKKKKRERRGSPLARLEPEMFHYPKGFVIVQKSEMG